MEMSFEELCYKIYKCTFLEMVSLLNERALPWYKILIILNFICHFVWQKKMKEKY